MKRIALLALLCAPLLTSCAAASVRYSPGAFRVTDSPNDNAAASCAVAPVLLPVPASTVRVLHLRITQGAYAWEDSSSVTAGLAWNVTPPDVPAPSLISAISWSSDAGGAGCPTQPPLTRTPLAIRTAPAAPALVAY
jgi:hypothetical protein